LKLGSGGIVLIALIVALILAGVITVYFFSPATLGIRPTGQTCERDNQIPADEEQLVTRIRQDQTFVEAENGSTYYFQSISQAQESYSTGTTLTSSLIVTFCNSPHNRTLGVVIDPSTLAIVRIDVGTLNCGNVPLGAGGG
jgi:hypothetical protein